MDITKELLEELYIIRGLTLREIAPLVGSSPTTVRRRLQSFGIQSREAGPSRETWWQNEEYLRSEYIVKKLSTPSIARNVASTPSTVITWLKKFGIELRGQGSHWSWTPIPEETRQKMSAAKKGKFLGEDNPNWKGAEISADVRERRSYIAKKWRETILARDKNTCQKCGSKERLHVHHLIPFADDPDRRWDLKNGITVCVSCHEAIHQRSFPDWITGRKPSRNSKPDIVKIETKPTLEISKSQLEKLYQKHGSVAKVANALGFNAETVRKRMVKFGLTRRGVGGRRSFQITKEELEVLYDEHSMREIADIFGVGETVIWSRIHEYGIIKR